MRVACIRVGLLLLLAAALPACGGGEDDESEPAPRPPAPAQVEPPPESEPLLSDGYYEDPDGDAIPSAIELLIDSEPNVDDCFTELDCPGIDRAGAGGIGRRESLLMILDASGSMAGSAGGETKIDAARGALARYVTGTPDSVDVGFMVYGHRGSNRPSGKAESCAGVEVLSGLGEVDYRSFPRTLRRFQPTGYTPIGGSLKRAAQAFRGREADSNRIVLVTDGIETCGDDPVAAAGALKRAGIAVTVDVVGFDIASDADARALREIARATGGEYTDAGTAAELEGFVDARLQAGVQTARARLCAANQASELRLCQANRITDARLALANMATELRLDDEIERADALTEAQDRMNEQHAEINERREEAIGRQGERIEREAREAQRRLRRRYGPRASLGADAYACRPGALLAFLGRLGRLEPPPSASAT